jgi:hypothetical protein
MVGYMDFTKHHTISGVRETGHFNIVASIEDKLHCYAHLERNGSCYQVSNRSFAVSTAYKYSRFLMDISGIFTLLSCLMSF